MYWIIFLMGTYGASWGLVVVQVESKVGQSRNDGSESKEPLHIDEWSWGW
jgi:hypothetical protein